MSKITVMTSKGISLQVVAGDIVRSAIKHGHNAKLQIGMTQVTTIAKQSDRIIIFMPFDLHYVLSWISLYHTLKNAGKDAIFYTTVEGVPDPMLLEIWVPNVVKPIANSEATASFLKEAGIDVAGIVKHGVDMELFDQIRGSRKPNIKKNVVFGTVAFSHPRKGFDELEKIVQMALNRLPEARFHIISDHIAYERFMGYPNVIIDPVFSQLQRHELIERMKSFDFYLCTSKAEGFGLPVLESQALGIPVIHADYKPLSEISHKLNLKVPVKYTQDIRLDEAIIYRFHMYDVKDMFERVVEACDLYLNRHDEYLEMSNELVEHARKFDIVHMYEPLVT
uniref:Glycosyltransferase n=1 Tax=Ignisphaera aggregans TaxID=334771 RepID=A0A7J3JR00_9CREN